ncbi:MAG: beta-ketoacyl-[acyl-carrier-protein] synthase family protein [Solirubrobacteraceae bacterium]
MITGLGVVTGLGVGTQPTWEGLLAGSSAVAAIDAYDASSLRCQVGASVRDLNPREYVAHRRSLRTMTRHDLLATVAATLAVRDSGLELGEDPEGRVALFVGGNKEINDPDKWEDVALAVRREDGTVDMRSFGEQAPSLVAPLFYLEGLQAATLFYISEAFGMRGANTYFAGTAESGMVAIGRAFRAVRRGEADVAVAGAADAPLSWWNMAKMDTLGVLSARDPSGRGPCRPYDLTRDGAVLGEGGAYVVVEEYQAARARGARIYAELTGFGAGTDPDRLVTPEPAGRYLGAAIEAALREAGTAPEAIGYVAADGSGTRLGDASEASALRGVFGAADGLVASSVKAATGHLVAGAGALNVAVAALAIERGVLPPTRGLEDVDPVCAGIDWNPGSARERTVSAALALARGWEDQNVALTLHAV